MQRTKVDIKKQRGKKQKKSTEQLKITMVGFFFPTIFTLPSHHELFLYIHHRITGQRLPFFSLGADEWVSSIGYS